MGMQSSRSDLKRRLPHDRQSPELLERGSKSLKTESGQSPGPLSCSSLGSAADPDDFGVEDMELARRNTYHLHFDAKEEPQPLFEILDDPSTEPPQLDPDHQFAAIKDPLLTDALSKLVASIPGSFDNEKYLHDIEVDDHTDSEDGDIVIVEETRPRFICPFYAKDRERYHGCLTGADLTSILEVKRHVCRDHRLPYYCPICYNTFEHASDRDGHIRERGCAREARPDLQGVGREQVTLLSQVPRDLSDADQWFVISNIVLPGKEPPPSVFLGGGVESAVARVRAFWDHEGTEIVSDFLAEHIPELDQYTIPDEERSLAALYAAVGNDMVEAVIDSFKDLGGIFQRNAVNLTERWGMIGTDLLERLRASFGDIIST